VAEYAADIDGDGRIDLVTNDGGDRVRVYRGHDGLVDDTPLADLPIVIPEGRDPVFVHDVTGDGRAEIFVWGRRGEPAALLVAR
jgi:hypothetical protein